MGLDISLLETFALVADLQSFSGAAKKLGLTQPAVSFQIKSLEKELGAPLIDRSGGKVILTPAGHTAYRHARNIISDRDSMMADIPRATGEVAGELLIGASTIPGEYLLPPLFKGFRKAHPRVSVSMDIDDSGGVFQNLTAENIEIGFVGVPSSGKHVVQRDFAGDRLVLIAPPGHPEIKGDAISSSELLVLPFVNREKSSGTRKTFEAAMNDRGMSPDELNVVAELGSTHAVLSAVQAGVGVSLVSIYAAEPLEKLGSVRAVEIYDLDLTRRFYAVYIEKRPLSLPAERFLEYCLE